MEMDVVSLNYWLTKFVQEVAKPCKERYPPENLVLVAGIRRFMAEKKHGEDINPLDTKDKRYLLFRRALDAEMKDGTRQGIGLKSKREEKLPVLEEERKFWEIGVLGNNTAKSLLETVSDLYNGKLFGLRSGEHRNLTLENFEVGMNYIRFEENVSKTFHGCLFDLKYEPRVVRRV